MRDEIKGDENTKCQTLPRRPYNTTPVSKHVETVTAYLATFVERRYPTIVLSSALFAQPQINRVCIPVCKRTQTPQQLLFIA